MHIQINKNYLIFDKYKVKCALGKGELVKKERRRSNYS